MGQNVLTFDCGKDDLNSEGEEDHPICIKQQVSVSLQAGQNMDAYVSYNHGGIGECSYRAALLSTQPAQVNTLTR